jgi:peptide/nickel transport system ATP-binding protein
MSDTAFIIDGLTVTVRREQREMDIVRNVSLYVGAGEVVGRVGPSGSGKSATVLASMGLFSGYPGVVAGRVVVAGHDVLPFAPEGARSRTRSRWLAFIAEQRALTDRVLGRHVGVVLQDPYGGLDPQRTIAQQVGDTLRRNRPEWSVADHARIAREALERVGLSDLDRITAALPFELSGGMCQRVMVALACAPGPEFLISDEATSALDAPNAVAVLRHLVPEDGVRGVLLITHDLGVACRYAHRIVALVDGEIVHEATPRELLDAADDDLPPPVVALRRSAALLAPSMREDSHG